jgi:hypothetical protein
MGIVPENTLPRIEWYRARIARWVEHAAALGLPAEDVAQLEEKFAAAVERDQEQRIAQQRARSATAARDNAMEELSRHGAAMISRIRATASLGGGSIYTLALLPAPAEPSPMGAPGTPSEFKAKLLSVGEIELKWTCKNPKGSEGTMYDVRRRIGNAGPFVSVGLIGKKRFLDTTVPAGSASVTYSVTAIRSTRRGESAQFTVHLGIEPGMPRAMFYPSGSHGAAA